VAQKTETQITEETSERVERIRAALAADQKVSEEDKAWLADLDAKQEIIQAALTEGRHFETARLENPEENLTLVRWTESIPMPDGTELVRLGVDEIKMGPAELPIIVRTVSYFEPGKISPTGTITSLISEGFERITGITGFGPGGEYAGLQIGDTRPSPIPGNTAAGIRPSSWDPANFGTASGGAGSVAGMVDPLQQSIDDFVNQSLNLPLPGVQSGGTSQSGSTSPSSDSSQPDSTDAAGLGSPGMGRTDGVDPIGESAGSSSGPGEQGGSDGGDKMDDNVDPDPGTEDQGGGDEQGDPMPEEGSDPEAGATGDLGGGGDEPATPQGEVTVGEGQIEVGTFYTQGESSDTYEYPSGDTVEIPHDTGGGGGGGGGDTDGDSEEEYHAADDYYSAGSAEIPPPGSGGATVEKASSGSGSSGGYSMSWEQWQAQQAATWSDPNWNPEGAPIDYGDAADPLRDPVIPTSDEMAKPDEVTPLILVDPSFYEESSIGPSTELEMVGALENTGNPLEENQSLAPGGGMPSTGEQEYIGGEAMASSGPEMVGGVAQDDPDEGGLGAMGGDDPLP
jgi:hypothetical protein